MNSPGQLRHALAELGTLPPIPCIARKILSLKINSDQGERALLELIEKDPPILSKVVGLANSPLFGSGRRILKLSDAAALLGSKRVKMVALSFAMMSQISRKPAGRLDIEGLWQHSLAVAMTMDTLARMMPIELRPSEDEIYLAGLLHDIGFLVLDYIDPDLSDQFHAKLVAKPGCTVDELEARMLGTSHGELGAELGRHWNLPESIIAVLDCHHHPDRECAAAARHLVFMTNLAEKLLPTFGIAEPTRSETSEEEWRFLGIDPARAEEIKGLAQRHTRELGEAIDA